MTMGIRRPNLSARGGLHSDQCTFSKSKTTGYLHEWERDEGTDLVDSVHQTQSATSGVSEVFIETIQVLAGVQQHAANMLVGVKLLISLRSIPIITSGCGSNAKNGGVEVKLAETWVSLPVDVLELRSLSLSYLNLGGLLLGFEDLQHLDGLETRSFDVPW